VNAPLASLLAAAVAVAACSDRSAPAAPPARAVVSARDAAAADAAAADADGRKIVVRSSTRCAECHGKMAGEWKKTPHSRAATSPLYQKLAAGDAACAGCHAPLAAYLGPDHAAAAEGVTCDVCHSIAAVDLDREPRFTLAVHDMIKYGPLCDADDHYFHRMGCSPLHEKAELCGACHQRVVRGPDGPIPVYTTYQEWKDSPYAGKGYTCQACHMPGDRAEVAEGEKARDDVPHHGFFGDGALRKGAARLDVMLPMARGGGAVPPPVLVAVENFAGHDLPSGFPGKRVVLRVVVHGDRGAELARAEEIFERRLVDAAGRLVAYPAAVKVASDNRLRPQDRRELPLFLGGLPAGAREVRAELVWQSIAPELAAELGVPVVEEPIATARRRIGRRR